MYYFVCLIQLLLPNQINHYYYYYYYYCPFSDKLHPKDMNTKLLESNSTNNNIKKIRETQSLTVPTRKHMKCQLLRANITCTPPMSTNATANLTT